MVPEVLIKAFIKKDGAFVSSHVSKIKANNIFYLLIDGVPTKPMKAIKDSFLDLNNKWTTTCCNPESK